jgi:hypothetical protein
VIVPPTRQDAAEDFRLTHGLLQAHVVGRIPIERLARDYGMTAARLRTRLLDHLAACFVAVQGPTVEQEAAPAAPPAEPSSIAVSVLPVVRVRERVQPVPPAPERRTRIHAVRSA